MQGVGQKQCKAFDENNASPDRRGSGFLSATCAELKLMVEGVIKCVKNVAAQVSDDSLDDVCNALHID